MKNLILLFAMILLPAAGFAQSGTAGSLTWSLSGGMLTISGTGAMSDYDVLSRPATWYHYRENITSVIIENGVTSIGKEAFYNCSGLTSVTIPASVTSIGAEGFLRMQRPDIREHSRRRDKYWKRGFWQMPKPDIRDHTRQRDKYWSGGFLQLRRPDVRRHPQLGNVDWG
jgi:hypothetical protein